jgi:hypothetical protein
MKEKQDRKKTAFQAMIFIIILVIAIIGLWSFAQYIQDNDDVETIEDPITVSMWIITDDWAIEYLDVPTTNNTVYKLLMECSSSYDFSVSSIYWQGYESVFVNSINGTQNGENGMWWQYYVNDAYGEIGCDRKEIFDGDIVEWKFEEPGQ